ncbi:MAG: hypothetical protein KDD50_03700 [Bdellovibrionales bacterium]|nr:hypothetical protein [Bdellovibrionales bacterium]
MKSSYKIFFICLSIITFFSLTHLSTLAFASRSVVTDYRTQFLLNQANKSSDWQKKFCQFKRGIKGIKKNTYDKLIPLLINEALSAGHNTSPCILIALAKSTEDAFQKNPQLIKLYTQKNILALFQYFIHQDNTRIETSYIVSYLGEAAIPFQQEIIKAFKKEDFHSQYYISPLFNLQTPDALEALYQGLRSEKPQIRLNSANVLGKTTKQKDKTVAILRSSIAYQQSKKNHQTLLAVIAAIGEFGPLAESAYTAIKNLYYSGLSKQVNDEELSLISLSSLFKISPKNTHTQLALQQALESNKPKLQTLGKQLIQEKKVD